MRDLLQFARPFLTSIDWTNPVTDDPLNEGLIARYLADMSQWGSVTWRDLMDRHHGTLTLMEPATDWGTPQGRPGGLGALDFDGSDEYVDTNHTFAEVSDADRLTISAWVNNGLTATETIVGGRAVSANDGFNFRLRGGIGGDPLELIIYGGFVQISGASGMAANTWHHVSATYDQVNVVFYVDGQQISSHAQTDAIDLAGTVYLGALNNQGTSVGFFNGPLDDICIYDRALPAAEVERLYEDSRLGSPLTVNRSAWLVPAPAVAAPVGGRIMSSLVGAGGLAGVGGIAGIGGGLAS